MSPGNFLPDEVGKLLTNKYIKIYEYKDKLY